MQLNVIELDPADTYYSVRDRLLHNGRARAVLVIPERGNRLGGVELALLRRLADRERLEFGLVTGNRKLARQARNLGLPAFANVTLAEHYRPGWWRSGRRREWLGFAPGADRRPPDTAGADARRRDRLWLLAIVLFVLLIIGSAVLAAIYFLPRATVTLTPESRPVQVILDLAAVPDDATASGHAVPARELQLVQAWEASGATTDDDEADHQRIRAQALQGLHAAAPELLGARLGPDELLLPASVEIEIVEGSFARGDDVSRLALEANIAGLSVPAADVNRIAYAALSAALPAGYEVDGDSYRLTVEPAAPAGAGTFQVTAQATARGDIDADALPSLLSGRRLEEAVATLNGTQPLAEPPRIDFRPGWWWDFGRFPFRAGRIQVEIAP